MTTERQTGIGIIMLIILILALSVLPVAGFTIKPATIVLDVEPGTLYRIPVMLSAGVNDPEETLTLAVLGLGQSPPDGSYTGLESLQDTGPYTARPFTSTNTSTLHLTPGAETGFMVTFAIPEETQDGGRYAAIAIRSSTTGLPATTPEVLVPVFLTLPGGNSSGTGEITGLDFSTAESGMGLGIGTTFRNTGNHHITGAVNNVTITDVSGKVVAHASTTPLDPALIPGQEVRFKVSIESDLPDPSFTLTSRIEKQDGSLLAEQKESLPGTEREEEEGLEPEAPVPGGTPARSVPGFSALAVGIACTVHGILGFRKGEKG